MSIQKITVENLSERGEFTGLDQIWTLIKQSTVSTNTAILMSGFMFSSDLAALLLVDCFELHIETTESGFFIVCAFRIEDLHMFPKLGLDPSDADYPPAFEAGEFPLFHVFPGFGDATRCLLKIKGQDFDWGNWYKFGSPIVCFTVLSTPEKLSLMSM